MVIQWKPALAFYRVETGRIEPSRWKCALYRRQWYPFSYVKMRQRIENVHDIFRISSFSSSNSSSPDAVAHEHWGVWKWFNHRTARRSTQCFLLYLRGQHDAVCIWRFSSSFVRCLSVRCHLQMAAYIRTMVFVVIVTHPGSAAEFSGNVLRGIVWNR